MGRTNLNAVVAPHMTKAANPHNRKTGDWISESESSPPVTDSNITENASQIASEVGAILELAGVDTSGSPRKVSIAFCRFLGG